MLVPNMKRALSVIMLLAAFSFAKGQLIFNDTAFIGLKTLQLGDPLSKFGADVQKVSMSPPTYQDKEGNTYYQYAPALQHPVEIAGIKFYSVMCSFDADNNLVGLCLSKWTPDENFTRMTRKHYRQLITYMTEAFRKKGKKKIYYPQVHEAYEWTKGPTVVEVNIQQTGKVESTSFGISLHLHPIHSVANK